MASVVNTTQPQTICELRVTAGGDRGARALACLLVAVGQLQGLLTLSMRSGTDPLQIRRPDQPESVTIRFAGAGPRPVRVNAVMSPHLMNLAGEGLLLLNSREHIHTETVRSLDADGIAENLGIPAYLPMVGAVARAAGWEDLDRVKAAVRMALQDVAPYWVESGLVAVEAGYFAVA